MNLSVFIGNQGLPFSVSGKLPSKKHIKFGDTLSTQKGTGERHSSIKGGRVVVHFLCVLSVRLKRCILDDFVALYTKEIFCTTQ